MNIILLPDFVSFLNDQTPEDFRGDKISRYLSTNRVEQEDFIPFIYFREETYCRSLVFKNETFELLVLTWLPRQTTPIHDNAGQRSWMTMQSGTLSLNEYKTADERNAPNTLEKMGEPKLKRSGELTEFFDNGSFFSLANLTSKPAVSVHLNAGPVPRCRTLNEKTQNLEWMPLAHFSSLALDL
jgi:predicted metal-dependent enzyme (double-stranded beta helix superfamily)